jgi:hypothetical protein
MIAAPAAFATPACVNGAERLHANDRLSAAAFLTAAEAARIALAAQPVRDAQVVSVRRMTWWQFAHATCSGVALHRVVYVVRLRFPTGFPFRLGRYEPGTLADAVVDAQTGARFTGHVLGRARGQR